MLKFSFHTRTKGNICSYITLLRNEPEWTDIPSSAVCRNSSISFLELGRIFILTTPFFLYFDVLCRKGTMEWLISRHKNWDKKKTRKQIIDTITQRNFIGKTIHALFLKNYFAYIIFNMTYEPNHSCTHAICFHCGSLTHSANHGKEICLTCAVLCCFSCR